MLIHLHITHDCFHTTAELSSCDRELKYVLSSTLQKRFGDVCPYITQLFKWTWNFQNYAMNFTPRRTLDFHCFKRPNKETWPARQACCLWWTELWSVGYPCFVSLPLTTPQLTGESNHYTASFSKLISKFSGPSKRVYGSGSQTFWSQNHFTLSKVIENLKDFKFMQAISTDMYYIWN